MKKLLILLCFCLIFLSGCSVPTQYTVAQLPDGSIVQNIYIPFSAEEFVNLGVDNETIQKMSNTIKYNMDSYFLNMYNNFKTRLDADTSLNENQKNVLLSLSPSQLQMLGSGSMSGIEYNIKFRSAIAYYYFNMNMNYDEIVEELSKDETVVQDGFFTDKHINTNPTIFGVQYDATQTLAQFITNTCKKVLTENTSLTEEQIESVIPKQYMYRYGIPTKRLHTNADAVRYVDGIYYHEWNIDVENSTREISTWTIVPNNNVWYALALGIGMLIVLVGFVVVMIIDKKQKNNNKDENVVEIDV